MCRPARCVGLQRGLAGIERLLPREPGWAHTMGRVARRSGCPRCCTVLPPSVDDAAALRTGGEAFPRVRGGPRGSGLPSRPGWVGPKTSRRQGEFIYRMDQLEMIDEIGRPNVGLLVDSFHWFTAGHTVEELVRVPKERVVHVHINDAPDRPRDEQIDMERLLPGEGVHRPGGITRRATPRLATRTTWASRPSAPS